MLQAVPSLGRLRLYFRLRYRILAVEWRCVAAVNVRGCCSDAYTAVVADALFGRSGSRIPEAPIWESRSCGWLAQSFLYFLARRLAGLSVGRLSASPVLSVRIQGSYNQLPGSA